jgi:hypothetical protein
MQTPEHAIGQAIFVRTDVPDFPETTVPFQTLGELVTVCSEVRPGMLLDKVVIYATIGEDARSVTLRFMSAGKDGDPASRSRRPDSKPAH